jgi:hypothetical protein
VLSFNNWCATQVFDVELLAIRTCERRQMAMFSDVVCT